MNQEVEQENTAPGRSGQALAGAESHTRKIKFEGYGEEMLEKRVKPSGNSGRVYLPPEWVGKNVKIIRLD